jgi:phosphotransferase system IIB component
MEKPGGEGGGLVAGERVENCAARLSQEFEQEAGAEQAKDRNADGCLEARQTDGLPVLIGNDATPRK